MTAATHRRMLIAAVAIVALVAGFAAWSAEVALGNDVSASVSLTKTVDPASAAGWSFDYTISPAPGGQTATKTVTSAAPTVSWVDLIPGVAYTITETGLSSGYVAGAISCGGGGNTFTPTPGQAVVCTATNQKLASLVVTKVATPTPGAPVGFGFAVYRLDGNPIQGDAVQISNTLLAPGSPVTINGLLPSPDYVVDETSLPAGWAEESVVCTGVDPATQQPFTRTLYSTGAAGPDPSFPLHPGATVTCTITNRAQTGTIIVKKVTKPAATGSFDFTTTGTGYGSFTLTGGGQNSQALDPGTYSVMELLPPGWILTGIGGSTDPAAPHGCVVTGSGGSTGIGDLVTRTAVVNLAAGDTVTCTFENTAQGTTRTQGFWATHASLANIAWFGGTAFGHAFPGVAAVSGIGDTLLCGRSVVTKEQLLGGFWSSVARTSAGSKRSPLDQARMQLLQQLLAAELNASAFGSAPGVGSFTAWEAAYCGTSTTAVRTAMTQASSFNAAGDSGAFTPGTSSDARNARTIADRAFWDVLP